VGLHGEGEEGVKAPSRVCAQLLLVLLHCCLCRAQKGMQGNGIHNRHISNGVALGHVEWDVALERVLFGEEQCHPRRCQRHRQSKGVRGGRG
jgi:hypothetical protein